MSLYCVTIHTSIIKYCLVSLHQNILYDYCITFLFFLKIMEKKDTDLLSALSLVQYCISEYYNKSEVCVKSTA